MIKSSTTDCKNITVEQRNLVTFKVDKEFSIKDNNLGLTALLSFKVPEMELKGLPLIVTDKSNGEVVSFLYEG
jgi:hypothetical protein